MSAPTPGPWEAVNIGRVRDRFAVLAPDGCTVANEVVGGGSSANGEANARLIAAAPDLLEALSFVKSELEMASFDPPKMLFVVRAALAKARGE